MNEKGVALWAERFWRDVGWKEKFPRSLEGPVSWALPLAIVILPRLGVDDLRGWLSEYNIAIPCIVPDRLLRACLLATRGRGIVFLDGGDTDAERRLSLAHEVVHFVEDYLVPRERAQKAIGGNAIEVLDGIRPPTLEERLDGYLKGVRLGTYIDYMDRTSEGEMSTRALLDAEDRTDRVALELLAPAGIIIRRMEAAGVSWIKNSAFRIAEQILMDDFGLPVNTADSYGRYLVVRRRGRVSFREWLES